MNRACIACACGMPARNLSLKQSVEGKCSIACAALVKNPTQVHADTLAFDPSNPLWPEPSRFLVFTIFLQKKGLSPSLSLSLNVSP